MTFVTGNNSIDSLLYSSWNPVAGQAVSLTYSFLTRVPADATSDDANGFKAMTAGQQQGVREALATWAAVANISFTEAASGGDIQIGTNDQGTQSSGYAYLPGSGSVSLFTNNKNTYNFSFADGDFGIAVLIHELGHTLGLKHPGDYDSTGTSIDGPFLPAATDNIDYTQMSYNTGAGFKLNGNYGITPMLYDIQAMQYLYGANMSYHTGADTYSFGRDAALQCIWDAGGTDTLDFSSCSTATIINLNAGSFSETAPGYNNISIAYNVTIERAIAGSGGSTIYANAAGNVIIGGAGSDIIHEGAGNDQITGGGGRDAVIFDKGFSAFTVGGSLAALTVSGDGVDTLNGIATLKFSDRTIELANFDAVQGGTANADVLVAGAGNELITGGAGIDVLKFSGARSGYQVGANGAGFIVADQLGSGGTDLLSGIERLQFADGSGVALDIGGAAGQTYRLYQAAFNRTPDAGGVGFWLDQLDHGLTLLKMSQFFLDSPESVRTYGALDNTAFVNLMYANVLHRAPDASGLDFYLHGFDAGQFTRAQVLQGFSESPENQAAVIGSITNGVTYTIV
jgi:hypothetical protein